MAPEQLNKGDTYRGQGGPGARVSFCSGVTSEEAAQ